MKNHQDQLYYEWNDFNSDCSIVVRAMAHEQFNPDVIIGPGRGGYPFGVMLSHYFKCPFEAFNWQTRDGVVEDSDTLQLLLSKYIKSNILIVDDINDSGKTLLGIQDIVWDSNANSSIGDIKYATLFDKESSDFGDVDFTANIVLPDEEKWIVFPYEEWWK